MSNLKRILTRIGIGNVQVDTFLAKDRLVIGEEVRGTVKITGGSLPQIINGIHLTIATEFMREVKERIIYTRYDLHRERLTEKITVTAYEIKEIPFTFPVPIDTPLTLGHKLVWLHTDVDVKNAVNPADNTYIDILPNTLMNQVLTGLKNIGFHLHEMKLEETSYQFRKRLPFAQEFEFIPVSGSFLKKLNELEVMFIPTSPDRLEVVMEIDRKMRGISGLLSKALDTNETAVHFAMTEQDKGTAEEKIKEVLSRWL